jgi:hypothetical protein
VTTVVCDPMYEFCVVRNCTTSPVNGASRQLVTAILTGTAGRDYRTVQGIIRGPSDYIKIDEIHSTQIMRRLLNVKPSVGNLNLAKDDDNRNPEH